MQTSIDLIIFLTLFAELIGVRRIAAHDLHSSRNIMTIIDRIPKILDQPKAIWP